jgi:hypothetical protein
MPNDLQALQPGTWHVVEVSWHREPLGRELVHTYPTITLSPHQLHRACYCMPYTFRLAPRELPLTVRFMNRQCICRCQWTTWGSWGTRSRPNSSVNSSGGTTGSCEPARPSPTAQVASPSEPVASLLYATPNHLVCIIRGARHRLRRAFHQALVFVVNMTLVPSSNQSCIRHCCVTKRPHSDQSLICRCSCHVPDDTGAPASASGAGESIPRPKELQVLRPQFSRRLSRRSTSICDCNCRQASTGWTTLFHRIYYYVPYLMDLDWSLDTRTS